MSVICTIDRLWHAGIPNYRTDQTKGCCDEHLAIAERPDPRAGPLGAFVPTLRASLPPGATLLTPDLQGNGALHLQTSPIRVEDMVEALRTMLTEQGQQPPYSVVSMSLGAMVTVAWAQAYPHELLRCVLINTSLRPFSPFWRRLQVHNYRHCQTAVVPRECPRLGKGHHAHDLKPSSRRTRTRTRHTTTLAATARTPSRQYPKRPAPTLGGHPLSSPADQAIRAHAGAQRLG